MLSSGKNLRHLRQSVRHSNRAYNQKKCYIQAKNLQRHLIKAHVTCLQNLCTVLALVSLLAVLPFSSSSHIVNPSNTHAYTFLYICHSLNIQQAWNTLCKGPGTSSVNVWGHRPIVRQNNRANNEKKPIFRQRTYDINLRNAHGEYCTDLAKPLHCSGTNFYTCHPLNIHLISTHHSTMPTPAEGWTRASSISMGRYCQRGGPTASTTSLCWSSRPTTYNGTWASVTVITLMLRVTD